MSLTSEVRSRYWPSMYHVSISTVDGVCTASLVIACMNETYQFHAAIPIEYEDDPAYISQVLIAALPPL